MYPPNGSCAEPTVLQLPSQNVTWDCVKRLVNIQVDSVHHFSLIHYISCPVRDGNPDAVGKGLWVEQARPRGKGNPAGLAGFVLGKSMVAASDHPSILPVFAEGMFYTWL